MERDSYEENLNPVWVMVEIYNEHPNMLLDYPINLNEKESYQTLDPLERVFTRLAQQEELLVFKNPLIDGVEYTPNFFVYDALEQRGTIVDLNILRFKGYNRREINKEVKKNLKEIKKIEKRGISTTLLNREDLMNMLRNGKIDIF
jgi:hypothetical protein